VSAPNLTACPVGVGGETFETREAASQLPPTVPWQMSGSLLFSYFGMRSFTSVIAFCAPATTPGMRSSTENAPALGAARHMASISEVQIPV